MLRDPISDGEAAPASFDSRSRYRDAFFGDLVPEIENRGYTPLLFGPVSGGAQTLRRCAGHRSFPMLRLEQCAEGLRRAVAEIASAPRDRMESARRDARLFTERYLRAPSPAALGAFFMEAGDARPLGP